MSALPDFNSLFTTLTGHAPFPWQQALYDRFLAGDFPQTCTLPTGLGKTSIIPIWLIALAHAPSIIPRRLAYVVNRRTVVDQATDEVKCVRKRLNDLPDLKKTLAALCSDPAQYDAKDSSPLAISTLRGQYADNAEWTADPARPAVITGTVDMIGSRLLFSGYGTGFKRRPTHAALLGQDTLLIHDEAHLEPAFQNLLEAIVKTQADEAAPQITSRPLPLRVMALTATPRGGGGNGDGQNNLPFGLTSEEKDGKIPSVKERLQAKKGIAFHEIADEKQLVETVTALALDHKDSSQAILIYLRTVEAVQKVVAALEKKVSKSNVLPLTGTIRGLERDELVRKPTFKRFLPAPPQDEPPSTVYLVSTSAGEVGVNITADHLVCDLTTFDSMAQRFGRVNRFGKGDARIDIVSSENFDDKSYDQARQKTLELLRQLPQREDGRRDASPQALGDLIECVGSTIRDAAYAPPPEILAATDILFDAWSLTSVAMHKEPMPGRPPVADWLHGISEWQPPETSFAWREEVAQFTEELLKEHSPEDVLDDFPLKPHELLRVPSTTALKTLNAMAESSANIHVWLQKSDGTVEVTSLDQLAREASRNLRTINDATVILPPTIGGLSEQGMLSDSASYDVTRHTSAAPSDEQSDEVEEVSGSENAASSPKEYDVSCESRDADKNPLRARRWNDQDCPPSMRLVRVIEFPATDGSDEQPLNRWSWYVRRDPAAGTDYARFNQELQPHLDHAAKFASAIAEAVHLNEPERTAVIVAAKYHDLGKNRQLWQQGIGNRDYANGCVLAKSNGRQVPFTHTYRHEFGSLLDLRNEPEFQALDAQPDVQNLILHLIAAHHGRARPHFPSPPDRNEILDPNWPVQDAIELAESVPRRFARLQRCYGRWNLAWLETLVRAADVMASQIDDQHQEEPR